MADNINHPPHYTAGIECADYIESHKMDFFQGNAIKYLTRFRLKGTALDDLSKAKWYIDRLIEMEYKEKGISCEINEHGLSVNSQSRTPKSGEKVLNTSTAMGKGPPIGRAPADFTAS